MHLFGVHVESLRHGPVDAFDAQVFPQHHDHVGDAVEGSLPLQLGQTQLMLGCRKRPRALVDRFPQPRVPQPDQRGGEQQGAGQHPDDQFIAFPEGVSDIIGEAQPLAVDPRQDALLLGEVDAFLENGEQLRVPLLHGHAVVAHEERLSNLLDFAGELPRIDVVHDDLLVADQGVEFESESELNDAFARFKELADKKHEIYDDDLQALVTETNMESENERCQLVGLKVCSETGEKPHAVITLNMDGKELSAESDGGGPVDASFKAIEKIVNSQTELQLYSVNNITSGTDSQGEVTVRLEKGGRIVNGQGADTDIVIASAKSYINALNKILEPSERAHPQTGDV